MPGPVQMPPETAHTLLKGDRLSRDFTAVGVEDTVAQALEKLRAHRFVGLPRGEARETRPGRMALKRFPWLLVNIAGGFLAATTTRLFERTVAELVVVSAFIPVVLVLSESLGVQTTAVAASMVTHGEVDRKVVAREVLAASLAGLMAAAVVALLGRVYSPGFGFPLALFVAVPVSDNVTLLTYFGWVTRVLL
ncbi:magnesium transporter [Corallococcus sp. CA054B]|uniref:magnesium transporter n=1 Tax=Corallococcus sp. CA054B TaxID=2316734 RepID=UPI000EA0B38A|nr:magnesium transporter [Corallococcus sp. CA054B]RKG65997.1 magnesium transporter [Corallococcus sp. CA054B]